MIKKFNNACHLLLASDTSRLLQLSFLMLFVELALIRWTGSNIFFISFFSNFILLASFLGIGVGFLRSRSSRHFFAFSPILLALLIYFCYQFHYEYQINIDRINNDLIYFDVLFNKNILPVSLTLPITFVITTAVMAAIADGTARTFQKFPPLAAYRLDILGSLLGIIVFSILSFLNASPLFWGMIISLLFISLLIKDWRLHPLLTLLQISALILLVTTFAKETRTGYYWSPYYKIVIQKYAGERYVVNANGMPQQTIESVKQRKETKPFYFLPYQHRVGHAPLDNVLIIGAGTGGDVAIALAEGANHVDAVEIDPLLYRLGKRLHPDQPYNDPRVHVFINDGRAFLQQSVNQYDMILFGLPDSLMLISGQSSLRLESYLFTLEAISTVKNHLKPDGIFTLYNYYNYRFIVDRLANTLATVFDQTPCLDTYGAENHWLSVLTISRTPSAIQCRTPWYPVTTYTTPSTDNHPFFYLKDNRISILYIAALLFIFLTAIVAIKVMAASFYAIVNYLDLFFMGAAFLLLETKSIVNFALLFGSTWFVNALVFISILLTAYLGIEVANRTMHLRTGRLYGVLLVSLFLAWMIPNHELLSLPLALRFFAATTLAFAPIFIANLIFADRFRYTLHSTEALGANFLGAVCGGLLEYVALIVGYQSLLILITLLYTIAIILMRFNYFSKNNSVKE
jgi:spermidine synthase